MLLVSSHELSCDSLVEVVNLVQGEWLSHELQANKGVSVIMKFPYALAIRHLWENLSPLLINELSPVTTGEFVGMQLSAVNFKVPKS
jgi:hypothetical protein